MNEQLLGGIEFVGGPMDGRQQWGSVSATELLFHIQGHGEAVYKPSRAIRTNGCCEFVFVGMRDSPDVPQPPK